nr:hypothetical protein [Tanacetum cinerariifolium]
MAVRVPFAMSPGLSTCIAEVAAISDLAFRKRFRSSYETLPLLSPPDLPSRKRYWGTYELVEDDDEEVEESLDSNSESEDTENEGPTIKDEDPDAGEEGLAAGDEGLGTRVKSLSLGGHEAIPEGQQRATLVVETAWRTLTTWIYLEDGIAYIDVFAYPPPAPPIKTLPSPMWSCGSLPVSPAPSIAPSPISSPMIPLTVPSPIASPAMAETEGFLTELGARVEMQGGLIHDHMVEESSDFDSENEDAEDKGPITEDEDPAAGDEGLAAGDEGPGMGVESRGLDDKSHGLDDEGHSVESGGFAPPVQTPPSPEWSSGLFLFSPTPSIVPSPISSPMMSLIVPLPISLLLATPTTTMPVDDDQCIEVGAQLEIYWSILQDHTQRLDAMPPALFVEIDRDTSLRYVITLDRLQRELQEMRGHVNALEQERDRRERTACMAMRVPPGMSPDLSVGIAEVAAMFDSAFRKRFRSSYDSSPSPTLPVRKRYRGTSELILSTDSEGDEKVEESSDFDSENEDAEDKGPITEDEDPAAGDEGTIMSEPLGLGYRGLRHRELALEEDHVYSTFKDGMVYIDVPTYPPPAPPVQTPPSPEWSSGLFLFSPTPSIVPSPISSPMMSLIVPLPISLLLATPTTTMPVDDDQCIEVGAQLEIYWSILQDHTQRLDAMPPALFVEIDRDERTAVTFRALWRLVLALEA